MVAFDQGHALAIGIDRKAGQEAGQSGSTAPTTSPQIQYVQALTHYPHRRATLLDMEEVAGSSPAWPIDINHAERLT